MASNIVSATINEEFPVAGQDNDSQGFRDNFSIIKNSLSAAKEEVESLQNNTAKLNVSNNFLGTDVIGANLSGTTFDTYSATINAASQDINFSNGHYQIVELAMGAGLNYTTTLTLNEWPASGKFGHVMVELRANDSNLPAGYKVIWATSTGQTGGTIYYQNNRYDFNSGQGAGVVTHGNYFPNNSNTTDQDLGGQEFRVKGNAIYLVEFTSRDGGATVLANYIGKFETP